MEQVIATSTPLDGVWEFPISMATGTQGITIYGTASEGRQTSSTVIVIVRDTVAPLVDIQLLSVGEGSISMELTPYDDTPITSYQVEFFQVMSYWTEEDPCSDGWVRFYAPSISFYLDENNTMQADVISTTTGCAVTRYTTETSDTIVRMPFDESYEIAARVKAIDSVGNQSDWWYSALSLFFPDYDDIIISL